MAPSLRDQAVDRLDVGEGGREDVRSTRGAVRDRPPDHAAEAAEAGRGRERRRIDIVGKTPLAPVNFAACWNSGGSPDNYIDVEASVGVVQLLVPPILYAETHGCYHLLCDFFRNSWMVQHHQATVPVPRIRDIVDDPDDLPEDEARPWLDAVDPSLVAGGQRSTTIWWADKTPLLDELFSEREDLDD